MIKIGKEKVKEMNHRFVVLKTCVFLVDCPCSNCGGSKSIEVRKGSIITITPEKKYVDNIGWYFLIDINKEFQVYINIHIFEENYNLKKYCSLLDFDLKLNYLEYKVNQALDDKNEIAFNQFSKALNDMMELKQSIING